jgi:hypothetical protein
MNETGEKLITSVRLVYGRRHGETEHGGGRYGRTYVLMESESS